MAKRIVNPYSKEELTYLKNIGYSASDIAFMLGRSTASVSFKRYALEHPDKTAENRRKMKTKIREAEKEKLGGRKYNIWTKEEIHKILTSKKKDSELALELGRTVNSVQKKRHRILKDKEQKKKRLTEITDFRAKNNKETP